MLEPTTSWKWGMCSIAVLQQLPSWTKTSFGSSLWEKKFRIHSTGGTARQLYDRAFELKTSSRTSITNLLFSWHLERLVRKHIVAKLMDSASSHSKKERKLPRQESTSCQTFVWSISFFYLVGRSLKREGWQKWGCTLWVEAEVRIIKVGLAKWCHFHLL